MKGNGMGRASLTEPFQKLIEVVKENVPDKQVRFKIYEAVYTAFQDLDWDTDYECAGMDDVFDDILRSNGAISDDD
jgi:hypothetical protein